MVEFRQRAIRAPRERHGGRTVLLEALRGFLNQVIKQWAQNAYVSVLIKGYA